jgi:hypothetical protein
MGFIASCLALDFFDDASPGLKSEFAHWSPSDCPSEGTANPGSRFWFDPRLKALSALEYRRCGILWPFVDDGSDDAGFRRFGAARSTRRGRPELRLPLAKNVRVGPEAGKSEVLSNHKQDSGGPARPMEANFFAFCFSHASRSKPSIVIPWRGLPN